MTWYAQAGQDAWVHGLIGDSGFFVDVGAYDGVEHSNTYALERLGWTGMCIEPGQAFDRLRLRRRCTVVHQAASDTTGGIRFDGFTVGGGGQYVPCATLDYLFDLVHAPPVIDYLSIDVEGHELQVLAGLDFERWTVRCATIEHNLYSRGPAHKEAIAALMDAHGFERVAEDVVAPGYGPYEDWWLAG